jgi:hypothetical protein
MSKPDFLFADENKAYDLAFAYGLKGTDPAEVSEMPFARKYEMQVHMGFNAGDELRESLSEELRLDTSSASLSHLMKFSSLEPTPTAD